MLTEIYGVRDDNRTSQNIMRAQQGSEAYLMGKYAGTGPWNRANDGPFGGQFRSYRSESVTQHFFGSPFLPTNPFNMLVVRKASKSVSVSFVTRLWACHILTL